jgi:hypothetical protein
MIAANIVTNTNINIDYSTLNDFVHYSSAENRLYNFMYKVGEIESYQSEVNINSPLTASNPSLVGSVTRASSSLNEIISKFDGFEYYLYFTSSSLTSSIVEYTLETGSFLEYYVAPYPKTNSTQPYSSYASSSATAQSWYATASNVATAYDIDNKDILIDTIPSYILEDPGNYLPYITFVNMIGQYFDNVWIYIDKLTDVWDNDNNLNKGISQDYIEGLIYGLTNNFTTLDKKGPKSILLDVEKGDLKVISSNSKVSKKTNIINTFYFKLSDSLILINGLLKIRVASTKLLDVPEIFSFLNPVDKTLNISFINATAEDVALEVLKAIYQISQYTDTLSALVYPNALELTAFKRTKEEVQEVIDIIQVPNGLDVATGPSIIEKTPYKNKARSLVIDATLIPAQLRRHALIDNGSATKVNGGQVVLLQEDKTLQTVKDKLNFLHQSRHGGYWYV